MTLYVFALTCAKRSGAASDGERINTPDHPLESDITAHTHKQRIHGQR